MGGRRKGKGSGFDIAFWGYDRRQVDRCLDDLTAQLDEVVSKLHSVDVLQAQLAQAYAEIGELRLAAETQPPFSDRLSGIMAAAEQLWRRAADTGAGAGERSGRPAQPVPTE
jgi:hypothetical protein